MGFIYARLTHMLVRIVQCAFFVDKFLCGRYFYVFSYYFCCFFFSLILFCRFCGTLARVCVYVLRDSILRRHSALIIFLFCAFFCLHCATHIHTRDWMCERAESRANNFVSVYCFYFCCIFILHRLGLKTTTKMRRSMCGCVCLVHVTCFSSDAKAGL